MICTVDSIPRGWSHYYKMYSGYRVNYTFREAIQSIWQCDHNEIWIIWSDIFPLLYFIHQLYYEQNATYLKYGLYFGIITSKLCSITYHIFNCISLQMNQTLLYLDLIGIANMAFGSPYIYEKVFEHHVFEVHCSVLFTLYAIAVSTYTYLFFMQIPYYKATKLSQTLIVLLGVYGNMPLFYITNYNNKFVNGSLCILSSYMIFYLGKIPESCFYYGATKLCNSHVFWHIGVFLSQYYYLLS
jgi:hypothetical protein